MTVSWASRQIFNFRDNEKRSPRWSTGTSTGTATEGDGGVLEWGMGMIMQHSKVTPGSVAEPVGVGIFRPEPVRGAAPTPASASKKSLTQIWPSLLEKRYSLNSAKFHFR